MGSMPPGTGPLSPDFSGITPELMGRFVGELERARQVIGEHAEVIGRVFAAHGVPASSLAAVREVERWIDDQLPELRRRHSLAVHTARLPGWSPDAVAGLGGSAGLVPYDEKRLLSPEEARRQGRDLAQACAEIDGFWDLHGNEEYRKIVAVLAEHEHDPEFAAAFFARLGARRSTELPGQLRRWLGESEDEAVATVSRAFGTAVSGGADVAGFVAVREAMEHQVEDEPEGAGDLLSAGRFPTEWLAQVVAARAFLPLGESVTSGPPRVGASLTPYLKALGNDPAAARLAISMVTQDSPLPRLPDLGSPVTRRPDQRPDLVTVLKALNDRAAVDAASADAFGRVLAAAAGAYDEHDGAHSEAAAGFAFMVMTQTSGFDFAAPTRVHLAELAGAYATEMTEGANLGDANQLLPSQFGAVDSRVPGLKPAFRLSPEDTFRFVKTFAGSPASLRPFEVVMGDLARRLIDQSAPAVLKSGDAKQLDDVFAALGNVRGFELAAAEALGRPIDQAADDAGDAWSFGFGTALGVGGLAVPGMGGAIFWTALSSGWSAYDTYEDESPSKMEEIRRTDEAETLGRQHAIAQALMDAGFPAKVTPRDYQADCPPGAAIADANGRLRPFGDIAKSGNPGLRALDQWFITNGQGSRDRNTIGERTSELSDVFDGRKSRARSRALEFDD
ncbi:hypothetical protein ACFHYQ_14410 [Sphaerimonospora cavernae]|uniref:Uncharacterized protein n=1 Tax=Sphaerimonospora cavernae TaxID=1740611 RepID=A0ABV6U4X1_9ACTN